MIISIHQPNYIPWIGYFHKIEHSDIFVILKLKVNKIVSELEKNEKIDKNLLKYMTIKVKEFDLKTNYFSIKEKDEVSRKKHNV